VVAEISYINITYKLMEESKLEKVVGGEQKKADFSSAILATKLNSKKHMKYSG